MIRCLGSNLVDVLSSGLNDMHLHLSMQNPAISAPEFRVEDVKPESAVLHYHSIRRGLQYIMEGTIQGMARVFFDIEIGLELLRGRDDGSCDHEVYLLTFPRQELALKAFFETKAALLSAASATTYTPTPALFYRLFPFHFILDKNCKLLQVICSGMTETL